MTKFWWKGEPLVTGSLRWRVLNNDLKNTMRELVSQLKPDTTIDEAVSMAHQKGLSIRFTLTKGDKV